VLLLACVLLPWVSSMRRAFVLLAMLGMAACGKSPTRPGRPDSRQRGARVPHLDLWPDGSHVRRRRPYSKAAAVRTSDTASFSLSCSIAGTGCGDRTAAFTIHELQSDTAAVITRLHLTFEHTCLGGSPPVVGEFGKAAGEIWIVDGSTPAVSASAAPIDFPIS
jgi:hypothetical protein